MENHGISISLPDIFETFNHKHNSQSLVNFLMSEQALFLWLAPLMKTVWGELDAFQWFRVITFLQSILALPKLTTP